MKAERSLRLADGLTIGWTAAPSRSDWLDRFGSILRLSTEPREADLHIHLSGGREDWPDFSIDGVPPCESPAWQRYSLHPLQVWQAPGAPHLVYEIQQPLSREQTLYSMWYSLYPLYPPLLRRRGIPVHAALAVRDGQGVLFSAPGGTGKTTTVDRLRDWQVLGDDEAWLTWTPEGKLYAQPMPTWNNLIIRRYDQTWPTEQAVPVQALVFLRQSKDERIESLPSGQATALLHQGVLQITGRALTAIPPADPVRVHDHLLRLTGDVVNTVPSFLLDLSLHGDFQSPLEAALEASTALHSRHGND